MGDDHDMALMEATPSVEEVQQRFDRNGATEFQENESEPSNEIKPGFEGFAQQIQEAIANGTVDARSPLGQKFSTSLRENAQLADDYNRLKGPGSAALKRDFRIKWANMAIYNLVLFRKRKVDELFEEFGEEGKYMAFDKLCIAEGGLDNPMAVQRAINYTNACIEQGHPFVVLGLMEKVH